MTQSVLVVEDEDLLRRSLERFLRHEGYEPLLAATGQQAVGLAGELTVDAALLDLKLPDADGIDVLRRLRELHPNLVAVVITAYGTVRSAVEAMKLGAFDYLLKPLDLDELRLVLERAIGIGRLTQRLAWIQEGNRRESTLESLIGESPAIVALKEQVRRVVRSSAATVLVRGETGTGKELVARAIHYESARAEHPFVDVNCAAIPADLLESELFGHERGAFTDARQAKRGLLEMAEGGTLLLDEIGQLTVPLQAKLLRVLETKRFRRIGGTRDMRADVRIVAATNEDLEARIAAGSFREDLYYRLSVLVLEVPPLRARGEDVVLLAKHFLDQLGSEHGRRVERLHPAAEAALRTHGWPGNVRELRNVVERLVLLHGGGEVLPHHLDLPVAAAVRPPGATRGRLRIVSAEDVEVTFPAEGMPFEQIERRLLVEALLAAKGNQSHAARLLHLSRDTLRYRLKRLGLEAPGEEEAR